MIPNTKDRALESSEVVASGRFGISLKDSAHIMNILRSTLYSDKVMAVLREYSANAYDAHRDAGKGDVPIKVTIPTSMSPTLRIRDYGSGLSQDDVFQIYTQYGASTKRNSNETVGMLGIGSKSGFAYSDTFVITSWHGGKKRIYVAALDATEEGVINLLTEEDCKEETGIEIQIAILPKDVLEFHTKAVKLFQYFEPRPTININLPPLPTVKARLQHGTMYEPNGSIQDWVAVMGCVPYRINLEQLSAETNGGVGVAPYITRISGALLFNIGDVQISASREELKYTERTKQVLIEKFSLLVDEFVQNTFDNLDSENITIWEKRIKAQIINRLGLPIPKKYKHIVEDEIKLQAVPESIQVTQNGSETVNVRINGNSRMLLHDSGKGIQGFHLGWGDYLVALKDVAATWDSVMPDLEKMLASTGLTGMPIVRLSTLPWYPPAQKSSKTKKTANKKHLVKTFKFDPAKSHYHPYSRSWEIVQREPQKEDVFVLLDKFKASYSFYNFYSVDQGLSKAFGDGAMPTIYGYKTTDKAPVDASKCVGTEYQTWRKQFIQSLFVGKTKRLHNHWEWSRFANDNFGYAPSRGQFEELYKQLGASHPIIALLKKHQAGERVMKSQKARRLINQLNFVHEILFPDGHKSECGAVIAATLDKYPLVRSYGIDELWGNRSEEWIKYVELIDSIK